MSTKIRLRSRDGNCLSWMGLRMRRRKVRKGKII